MKITRISIYQADITVARGGYAVSRGRIVREVDTTVVLIDTDAGTTGIGESCPMGTDYLGSDGMERVRCRDRWTGDAQWTLFRQ